MLRCCAEEEPHQRHWDSAGAMDQAPQGHHGSMLIASTMARQAGQVIETSSRLSRRPQAHSGHERSTTVGNVGIPRVLVQLPDAGTFDLNPGLQCPACTFFFPASLLSSTAVQRHVSTGRTEFPVVAEEYEVLAAHRHPGTT